MCHKIGLSPINTIGFGIKSVSSDILVPSPPANITSFIDNCLLIENYLIIILLALKFVSKNFSAHKSSQLSH
jgi:hypothetical protein